MKGRPPKPVELRRSEGNPGKRPLPASPTFAPLEVRPPRQLSPQAKLLWRRLVREFAASGLLRATDREALVVYCDLWATYEDAMAKVRQFGALVRTRSKDSGTPAIVVSPAWRVARDAKREMDSLWSRFGLTPIDRARLDAGGVETPENPLAVVLEMTQRT